VLHTTCHNNAQAQISGTKKHEMQKRDVLCLFGILKGVSIPATDFAATITVYADDGGISSY